MSLNAMPLAYRLRHLPTRHLLKTPFNSATEATLFAAAHLPTIAHDLAWEPEDPETTVTRRAYDALTWELHKGGYTCDCGEWIPEHDAWSHAETCADLRALAESRP